MTDPEELPADIAALLDTERTPFSPPAGAKERVFARIENTLAGGGGGSGASGAGSASGSSPGLLVVPPVTASWPAALLAAVSAVVGVGLGITWTSSIERPRQDNVAVAPADAPVVAPVTDPDPSAASPPLESAAPAVPPAAEVPPAPPAAQPRRPRAEKPAPQPASDTLAAEQALLEQARKHLRGGEPAAARAELLEHAEQFAQGQLAEEREALLVLALVKDGDRAAAIGRAERFRKRWPTSLHAGMVEAALAE